MPPRVVEAISSTYIDAKFTHAISDGLSVAEIAKANGVQTRKYSCLGARVAQTDQPLCKDLSLLDLKHEILYPNGYDRSTTGNVAECGLTKPGNRRAAGEADKNEDLNRHVRVDRVVRAQMHTGKPNSIQNG